MEADRRALKEWMTGLLPADRSRADIAHELGVDRKTISTILNPETANFGNGYTLLRYLRIVGALNDAPTEPAGLSRLAAIEASLERIESLLSTQPEGAVQAGMRLVDEAVDLWRERDERTPPARRRSAQ